MNPVLVTPPVAPVVALPLLKQQLRLDGTEEDLLLAQQEQAAVAWLDGWTGVLGRAINTQTWAEEFSGWGRHRLALPDVASAVVTFRDSAGDMQAGTAPVLFRSGSEAIAEVDGPATDLVRIEYACGMNAGQLAMAKSIILLAVGNWYRNRESVVIGAAASELPFALRSLVSALQWRKV